MRKLWCCLAVTLGFLNMTVHAQLTERTIDEIKAESLARAQRARVRAHVHQGGARRRAGGLLFHITFVVTKQEREPFALLPRVFRFGGHHRRAWAARVASRRAAGKLVKNVESKRLRVRGSLGLRRGLGRASKQSGANA